MNAIYSFNQIKLKGDAIYMINEIQANVVSVKGSGSQVNFDLMNLASKIKFEAGKVDVFLKNLSDAIAAKVAPFEVIACDPSINNYEIKFDGMFKNSEGRSYNQLEKLATNNGLLLCSKEQYILFLATIIHRLIEEGWSEEDAFCAVCTDSMKIWSYCTRDEAKMKFKTFQTASRTLTWIEGIRDRMHILKKDEENGVFYIAGGICGLHGSNSPLADIKASSAFNCSMFDSYATGLFVLP